MSPLAVFGIEILLGCLLGLSLLALGVVVFLNLKTIIKAILVIVLTTASGAILGYLIDRMLNEFPLWTMLGTALFGLGAIGGVLATLTDT